MGKATLIASGKGGTGKTTAAAAIASCLAQRGRRVLCIDADAGLKNLDLVLGIADRASPDFGDVIRGRCNLAEAAIAHPAVPNLFFLTAPLEPINSPKEAEGLANLIHTAAGGFDHCIIDAPAGLGSCFAAAAAAADRAIIVSAADPSSCRDSARVVMELRETGMRDIRLVVNRVRRSILFRTRQTIDDAIDAIGARLLGIVPEDRKVILAAAAETPLLLFGKGSAIAAFDRIARRTDGENIPLRF